MTPEPTRPPGAEAGPDIESHLTWSWLRADDLPEIAELREATDYLDDPVERVDLSSLRDLYDAPDAEPGRYGAVGRDRSGSLLAYAWGHPREGEGEWRFWLDWAVHPAWRYRGIGDACVAWLRDRGLAWWGQRRGAGSRAPVWLGAYVDEKLGLRCDQLRRAGFVAEKWLSDMRVRFSEVPPDRLPTIEVPGIRVVPFDEELSDQVRLAHNLAFSTVPGAGMVSAQVWDHILQATTVRPDWSWVAVVDDPARPDHGSVAGYAISSGYEASWESQGYQEGWTEFLGTVPAWRGRGVARAVLTRALQGFAEAGLQGAGLGVDLDRAEAAVRLFDDLGYRPTERLVLMGLRRGHAERAHGHGRGR